MESRDNSCAEKEKSVPKKAGEPQKLEGCRERVWHRRKNLNVEQTEKNQSTHWPVAAICGGGRKPAKEWAPGLKKGHVQEFPLEGALHCCDQRTNSNDVRRGALG